MKTTKHVMMAVCSLYLTLSQAVFAAGENNLDKAANGIQDQGPQQKLYQKEQRALIKESEPAMDKASSLLAAKDASTIAADGQCPAMLNQQFKKLHSKDNIDFCSSFQGKVILAVNTASRCGYTPQFKALEALYQKYKDKGLVIVGFPSNDFRQEHKDESKTAEVCYKNYGVSFPMVATTSVKGDSANPFYKALADASGSTPKWNFFKYLVSRDTNKVKMFPASTSPDDEALVQDIEAFLAKS